MTAAAGATGRRYPWPLIRELLADTIEEVLQEFQAEDQVEVAAASPCCTSQSWPHIVIMRCELDCVGMPLLPSVF